MRANSTTTAQRVGLALTALLGAAAILLTTSGARAAGTALDVQSARCTGMAAACTAAIDNSTAIFYNPAGIARGKTLDAEVGVTLIETGVRFKDATTGNVTSMPFRVVPPFTAYVSGGVTRHLSLGIGFFTPYGLAIKWPDGWEGRSLITKATFQSYDLNPTIAYRWGPVRIGAGLQVLRATVELQKDIAFLPGQYGSADLGAGAWGVGGNGGVQVDAIKRFLTLGATYRSAVHFDFDRGLAHFANVPALFTSTFFDQRVSTGLNNPDQFAAGASTRPIENLLFEFDVVWTGWSKLRSIDLNFPNTASLSSSEPKNWHDTVNYHLGGEGIIARNWRVRGGLLFDPTPSPSDTLGPDLPDASRLNIAFGGGYVHDCGIRVDLAYQILVLFNHTSTLPTLPGEYSGVVNVLGISVGYAWPKTPYWEMPPSPATIEPAPAPPAVAPPVSPPPPPPPPAPAAPAPAAPPPSTMAPAPPPATPAPSAPAPSPAPPGAPAPTAPAPAPPGSMPPAVPPPPASGSPPPAAPPSTGLPPPVVPPRANP